MALVQPVNLLPPAVERTIEFKGLNRRDYFEEGEFADMENLASDRYPYLAPRKLRGSLALPTGVVRPLQIMARNDKLCMIAIDDQDAVNFYYDGVKVSAVTGLNTASYMVAINTKICFFPQKTYIEILRDGTIGAFGNLDWSLANGTYYTSLGTDTFSFAALPEGATDWIKADDSVHILGTLTINSNSYDIDVYCLVKLVTTNPQHISVEADSILQATEQTTGTGTFVGTIERSSPDFDVVIEWNNRLWGASSSDNIIHACKLGDPTNWEYFQGTSMDSYYAEQGTDGEWTGAAIYSSHLVFFKESSMCRVYGSAPSNFQTANMECFGVEKGSERSIVTINDKTFYKSSIGIMAYQGGTPYLISEKFNAEYRNAVGGTEGLKYYVSLQKKGGGIDLMVLDVDRALWHKEDGLWMKATATVNNRLYCAHIGSETIYCGNNTICSDWLIIGENAAAGISVFNPKEPTESYENLHWMAHFGAFDEYVEERKIYSKLALRFKNEGPCHIYVYISLDEGEWELVKEYVSQKTGGEMIPIIPRRCDRYSIKIEGTGNVEIKSLTRRVRQGTHGKL